LEGGGKKKRKDVVDKEDPENGEKGIWHDTEQFQKKI